MGTAKWLSAMLLVVALGGLAGSAMSAPAAKRTTNAGQLAAAGVNVCAMLSAEDAQKIMGVPMQLKKVSNPSVCMYEEVAQRASALGKGTVSLAVNKRSSKAAEDAGWAQLKETRHLKAGEKNVQVLTGLGDEAYFTGNSVKGKVGVSGVIVRNGSSDLMLDVMVMEYVASPEAMKSVAKRIADGLN